VTLAPRFRQLGITITIIKKYEAGVAPGISQGMSGDYSLGAPEIAGDEPGMLRAVLCTPFLVTSLAVASHAS
jgi:hypothetical protein